mgnify:FL=1
MFDRCHRIRDGHWISFFYIELIKNKKKDYMRTYNKFYYTCISNIVIYTHNLNYTLFASLSRSRYSLFVARFCAAMGIEPCSFDSC